MNCLKCKTPIVREVDSTHGYHADCFAAEFSTEITSNFTHLVERRAQSAPKNLGDDFKHFNESFFHGKFRKYSAALGPANYILKMQQAECPELPAVEYLSNQLARLVNISVPDNHLILYSNVQPTFVSRNILDNASAATLDHIYKFLPEDSSFSCEELCEIISRETKRLSEVHKFTEICLFDSLIGNHDRHGRNLSFVTKAGGVRTLSPFYDNPSYIGIADDLMLEADLQPKGTISTKISAEPSIKDYVLEFSRLGYSEEVTKFRNKVVNKMSQIVATVREAPLLSPRRGSAFIKLIEKRLQELENA